jgi:glucose-6-phosphate isomerase
MQFNYQHAGITLNDVAQAASALKPYLSQLASAAQDNSYGTPESCLFLPSDAALREQVMSLVLKKKSDKLQEVMVIGIGGSSLGAQAVYQAVAATGVPLFFYDTLNARALGQAGERIKKITAHGGQVLIVIISKSGTTMETIANAAVLLKSLIEVDRDWQKRVIVISEPTSALASWSEKAGITLLPHQAQVGGRFSVMSVVGLLPLALAGVDIEELRAGARDVLASCLSAVSSENIALQSAVATYKNLQAGKTIHDLFLFHPDLEGLGKWWRQLAGESLGKDGKGITPTVSIGSTDLHSTGQLYLAGPADKFTAFVSVKAKSALSVPAIDENFSAIAPHLVGRSTDDIMAAIYQGAIGAYQKRGLPFVEIIFDALSTREIGAFMQFKMLETMLLARLLGVNGFDQRAVEEYKVITRQILSG